MLERAGRYEERRRPKGMYEEAAEARRVAGPPGAMGVAAEDEEGGRTTHGSEEPDTVREEAPAKIEEMSRLTCAGAGPGRARRRAAGAPAGPAEFDDDD